MGQRAKVWGSWGLSRAASLRMTRTCASRYLIDDNMAARGKGLDKVTCYGSSVLLQLQASQLARPVHPAHIAIAHACSRLSG